MRTGSQKPSRSQSRDRKGAGVPLRANGQPPLAHARGSDSAPRTLAPSHFPSAVERLSEEAQTQIHRLLDTDAGPGVIARKVQKLTGEKISVGDIRSHADQYQRSQQQRQKARRATDVLVEGVQEQGCEISALLRAALLESFTNLFANGKGKDIGILDWDAAHRRRRELTLKEKHAQLAERRVQVSEQRLQLDREKAEALLRKLDRKARAGQSLSPDDVRRIREIYGLDDGPQQSTDDPDTEPNHGTNEEIPD